MYNLDFELNGKSGVIHIDYLANTNVSESGFDMLTHLGFDVNMCMGYPTIHASIKNFEATGYRRLCGWIQVLKCEYFNSPEETSPVHTKFIIDSLYSNELPFFAYGYPAELYDAPCNNLIAPYEKLTWTAYTYLVTMPTHLTQNTISYLAAFQWGYTEWNEADKREVMLSPLKKISYDDWKNKLELLQEQFPKFSYC